MVEVLVAAIILVVGAVALAGITVAVAGQVNRSYDRTNQSTASIQAIEAMHRLGYDAAVSKMDTITVDGHDFVTKVSVTQTSARVKTVAVAVQAVGRLGTHTMTTRLYRTVQLPDPPVAGP